MEQHNKDGSLAGALLSIHNDLELSEEEEKAYQDKLSKLKEQVKIDCNPPKDVWWNNS